MRWNSFCQGMAKRQNLTIASADQGLARSDEVVS
jgi:hypothetical protein